MNASFQPPSSTAAFAAISHKPVAGLPIVRERRRYIAGNGVKPHHQKKSPRDYKAFKMAPAAGLDPDMAWRPEDCDQGPFEPCSQGVARGRFTLGWPGRRFSRVAIIQPR